ncbi:hypothetical protein [Pseudofulvibacter geojedonensis]|uniref:Uncharacterized protein n=1 Tax=Pseudofulvibacter geojedonensis TaxID=1123758 RepID=A0ABW3I5M4_9FLAO
MKLYKKIIKGVFIAITAIVWLYFLYEFFIKDYVKNREDFIDDPSIFIGIAFMLVLLLAIVYHVKFFNVYKTRKIWADTTMIDIMLIISNFVFSGIVIVFGMGGLISLLNMDNVLVAIIMPILMLTYGLYSFIEGLKVNQYLKRDLKFELESPIDDLGKE